MTVKTFTFNPIQENTYVLFDHTRQAAIIDAGCLFDAEKKSLDSFIEHNHLEIKYLLNTHCHFDHIIGNRYVSEKYGVQPAAHESDSEMVAALSETLHSFGIPLQVESQPIGRFLTEADTIEFGTVQLQIFHVPGHSRGSLCFYNAADGILFSGDVLFRGTVGRTDLPGGDYATLIKGITQKLLTLPDQTVVYSGHGTSTTIGDERRINPYL